MINYYEYRVHGAPGGLPMVRMANHTRSVYPAKGFLFAIFNLVGNRYSTKSTESPTATPPPAGARVDHQPRTHHAS